MQIAEPEACAPWAWAWPVRARGISPVSLFLQTNVMAHARSVCCAHCSVQKLRRRHDPCRMCDVVLYFIKYVCLVCFWTLEVPRERLSLSWFKKELVRA